MNVNLNENFILRKKTKNKRRKFIQGIANRTMCFFVIIIVILTDKNFFGSFYDKIF